MANVRLPNPGGDDGAWGNLLNDFLSVEHNADGSLKARSDGTMATLQSGKVPVTMLGSGSATASTYLRGDGTWATVATVAGATKRATLTFGSPNSGLNNGTPTSVGATTINSRAVQTLQANPTRYRFKISNASAQNSSNPATPIQLDTVWIGAPAYTDTAHNNKWLGDMQGTPKKVYDGPGAVPTSGTGDYTTPWITNSQEIAAYKPFVLSMGLTIGGSGTGMTMADIYGGLQFGATSNTQAGVNIPAGGYNYAGFPLDVRMEYEFAGQASDMVALVVGASGESGYSGSGDLSANARVLNDAVDAWPSVWAQRQGYHVINAGLFGSATTDWLDGNARPYARFDLTTTTPDIAIIGSMPSNDLSLSTSLSTIEANYMTIVANLRGKGINRIFGMTLPPRGLSGGDETNRKAFNEFIRAIPAGLEDYFDMDLILRNPANTAAVLPDLVSSDNVHPTRAGQRQIASGVRIGHSN